MANPELLAELAAALKDVEAETAKVTAVKGQLEKARERRNKAQAKVREIESEIRAQVEGGRSERPMFEGLKMEEAKATFTDPSPATNPRRKRSRREEAVPL